jgi:predicted nucleic acid-binding protein
MAGERLYFDTNIFIQIYEGGEDNTIATVLLELLAGSTRASEPRIVTSEITLAELLVRPLAVSDQLLVEHYEGLIIASRWLQVVPVERQVLRVAAQLRSRRRALRLPDAIHLASALTSSCTHLVTGDVGVHASDGLPILRPERDALEHVLKRWQP